MIPDFDMFRTWMFVIVDDMWQQLAPVADPSGLIPAPALPESHQSATKFAQRAELQKERTLRSLLPS